MGDAAKAAKDAAKGMKDAFNFSTDGSVKELKKLYDKWYKLGLLSGVVGTIQREVLANKYNGDAQHRIAGIQWGGGKEAAGGINDNGQMFMAGEGGKAELLGSFGGKTTVMPLENSGFVEAMAKAVYGAVTSAMDSAASGGDGNVYMDGTKVGQVLRDSDRRTGINSGLVRVTA